MAWRIILRGIHFIITVIRYAARKTKNVLSQFVVLRQSQYTVIYLVVMLQCFVSIS